MIKCTPKGYKGYNITPVPRKRTRSCITSPRNQHSATIGTQRCEETWTGADFLRALVKIERGKAISTAGVDAKHIDTFLINQLALPCQHATIGWNSVALVLRSLRAPNVKMAYKRVLVKWLVIHYHHIHIQGDLQQQRADRQAYLYQALLLALKDTYLCGDVCRLLCLLTRAEHVKPRRAAQLQSMRSAEAYKLVAYEIGCLLAVYKSYYPRRISAPDTPTSLLHLYQGVLDRTSPVSWLSCGPSFPPAHVAHTATCEYLQETQNANGMIAADNTMACGGNCVHTQKYEHTIAGTKKRTQAGEGTHAHTSLYRLAHKRKRKRGGAPSSQSDSESPPVPLRNTPGRSGKTHGRECARDRVRTHTPDVQAEHTLHTATYAQKDGSANTHTRAHSRAHARDMAGAQGHTRTHRPERRDSRSRNGTTAQDSVHTPPRPQRDVLRPALSPLQHGTQARGGISVAMEHVPIHTGMILRRGAVDFSRILQRRLDESRIDRASSAKASYHAWLQIWHSDAQQVSFACDYMLAIFPENRSVVGLVCDVHATIWSAVCELGLGGGVGNGREYSSEIDTYAHDRQGAWRQPGAGDRREVLIREQTDVQESAKVCTDEANTIDGIRAGLARMSGGEAGVSRGLVVEAVRGQWLLPCVGGFLVDCALTYMCVAVKCTDAAHSAGGSVRSEQTNPSVEREESPYTHTQAEVDSQTRCSWGDQSIRTNTGKRMPQPDSSTHYSDASRIPNFKQETRKSQHTHSTASQTTPHTRHGVSTTTHHTPVPIALCVCGTCPTTLLDHPFTSEFFELLSMYTPVSTPPGLAARSAHGHNEARTSVHKLARNGTQTEWVGGCGCMVDGGLMSIVNMLQSWSDLLVAMPTRDPSDSVRQRRLQHALFDTGHSLLCRALARRRAHSGAHARTSTRQYPHSPAQDQRVTLTRGNTGVKGPVSMFDIVDRLREATRRSGQHITPEGEDGVEALATSVTERPRDGPASPHQADQGDDTGRDIQNISDNCEEPNVAVLMTYLSNLLFSWDVHMDTHSLEYTCYAYYRLHMAVIDPYRHGSGIHGNSDHGKANQHVDDDLPVYYAHLPFHAYMRAVRDSCQAVALQHFVSVCLAIDGNAKFAQASYVEDVRTVINGRRFTMGDSEELWIRYYMVQGYTYDYATLLTQRRPWRSLTSVVGEFRKKHPRPGDPSEYISWLNTVGLPAIGELFGRT
ncbi:hypothetical protein SARC_03568 [Sphaeroforma arctica JP610]|uniref:Uncharacterized protein n=1 Tax=Sphaeroforma arctica JP610 TaxID=667725 RepID=A0A0L0G589_9EUKA|nr:hypothetical protein SARC_03568 [Sphaeroforma arctica JP610]KNC84207.1 hypothetical protein SARC_03568 [Sphaeroforma arctica JP610]|eukprot:XP_014158109.1 hypothetical protein SARC_03568 [Sphaeroforma arctica JP610]